MAVQRLHKGAQVGGWCHLHVSAECTCMLHATFACGWHQENVNTACDPQSLAWWCTESSPLQVTVGPWTERGFFYDFDLPHPLTERDLPKIRKEMTRILSKNLPFVCEEVTAAEAQSRIQARIAVVAGCGCRPHGFVKARARQVMRLLLLRRQPARSTNWRFCSRLWHATPKPLSQFTT